ncbi:MAG: ATP-grasp protein [Herminiimonas sp.]|nr:ATP-grasp protein [Herminiimonas sp.]MDB5852397.1 ATP-grasp protein [Herminiimonas sp.]
MATNFLVVGSSKPLLAQVMLAARTYTDCRIIAVCSHGTRYLRHSILCADYEEIDFTGEEDTEFVAMANRYAGRYQDLIVIPADCAASRMINRVRPLLKMPVVACPADSALDRLEDKWDFKRLCQDLGLRTPETIYVGDKHALHFPTVAARLGVPFVVKPTMEDSSRGAYIIGSEDEYNDVIRDNSTYRYAPLIAQRYVAGTDVGLNFHASHGRVTAISVQRRDDYLHDGSPIRFFADDYLQEVAHRIATATDYDGVMNVDARIEAETGAVFLFESNPRFWRSLSASTWCGLNFVEQCLRKHDLDKWPQASPREPPRLLLAGAADTYYHPFYRPPMWRHAVRGSGLRGRQARLMLLDVSNFLASSKVLANRLAKRIRGTMARLTTRPPPALVSSRFSGTP